MLLLIQYTLIFASVLALVALGGCFRNTVVSSTSDWKESWLWEHSAEPWR